EEKFEKMYEISGVYMLDEGLKMSLEPSHLARHERNRKRAEAEGKK
ncbi:MAG: lysine 2,3-aminomutase, partial [Fusobacterium periodonticum]|nr:lysine 2,3-aminomutase [Fusobacterium periodonticum]